MGCGLSREKDAGGGPRRRPGSVGDVVVFLPGLRVPRSVDFSQALAGRLDEASSRLSSLRARVVDMAMQESAAALKPKRRAAARHGSSTANLLQALEDYLPVLLGLVKEGEELLRYGGLVFCWLTILLFRLIQPVNSAGSELRHGVHFVWTNQEDNAEVCVGS
jgi:hypothetical protein